MSNTNPLALTERGGNDIHNMPSRRKIRCPKCGKNPRQITEHSYAITEFDYHEDDTIDREGYHESLEVFECRAECGECGHEWKLRNLTQITELTGYGWGGATR